MRTPPRTQPRSLPALVTADDLRQVQIGLSLLGRVIDRTEVIALSDAIGRVVAATVVVSSRPPCDLNGSELSEPVSAIAAGTLLEVSHLPVLASAGVTSIDVYARLRVGLVTLADPLQKGDCKDSLSMAARSAASGTTLRALIERLGAKALEVRCGRAVSASLAASLKMLFSNCDLVLISGFLTPTQTAILQSSLVANGEEATVEDVVVRPIGALQVGRSTSRLVIALSADLGMAFSAFTLLLSPLIRRMQGRSAPIADPQHASLASSFPWNAGHWGVFPARDVSAPGSLHTTLNSCLDGDMAVGFAGATGLAWQPSEAYEVSSAPVAFYPFHRWLT